MESEKGLFRKKLPYYAKQLNLIAIINKKNAVKNTMHGILLCAEFPIKWNSMALSLSLLAYKHILNSRILGILGV